MSELQRYLGYLVIRDIFFDNETRQLVIVFIINKKNFESNSIQDEINDTTLRV